MHPTDDNALLRQFAENHSDEAFAELIRSRQVCEMACKAGRWEDDGGMDASKTMACPECGNVVAVTDQFCSKCYVPLEPPTFWRRLGSWLCSALKPGSHTLVIRKKESFRTISKQGEAHVYQSLDQVPPEFRAGLEKLQAEAAKALKGEPSSGIVVRNEIRVFKFKDGSGKEQVYHSLNEMPPEQRALFEKVQARLNLPDQKTEG